MSWGWDDEASDDAFDGRVGDWDLLWSGCCCWDSRIGSARWRMESGWAVCAVWRLARRDVGDFVVAMVM